MTKLADEYGVDAQTVERDYVLTHIIESVGRVSTDERLVFKGGTALRLLHFEDYRFSADLDFSLTDGLSVDEARETIANALADVMDRVELTSLTLGSRPYLNFIGPLNREQNIKLDLSGRELVLAGGCDNFQVIERYEDQAGSEVNAYTVGEVSAEKLRCVIQRVQARDLYDLYQLFGDRDVDIEEVWPDFEEKARYKELDPNTFFERFEDRIPRWKKAWQREMDEHVPLTLHPHFEEVERSVRRELRRVS